jgi:hypothetical protein
MSKPNVYQAIQTKFIGASARRGSRVCASCDAGRIYVSYNDGLNSEGAHREAAEALAFKLGWTARRLVQGGIGSGYVFVFSDE